MFKITRPVFLYCQTPLHCGSGADLGIVDLPIQRERHSGFPKIEASSLKGALREAFEQNDRAIQVGNQMVIVKSNTSLAFGPEDGSEHAGALGFSEARILLFPVKSMKGVFAWVTCPQVLERFRNDLTLSSIPFDFAVPEEITVPQECDLFIKDNRVVLEEYTFEVNADTNDGKCTKLANWLSTNIFGNDPNYTFWADKLKKDLVILSDDAFRDFVNLSTEVITRTRIDTKTGTVQPGALFTEEYLPTDTILYTMVFASPVFKEEKGIFKQDGKAEEDLVMEYFTKGLSSIVQLGGNATLGKGIVRTKVLEVQDG